MTYEDKARLMMLIVACVMGGGWVVARLMAWAYEVGHRDGFHKGYRYARFGSGDAG